MQELRMSIENIVNRLKWSDPGVGKDLEKETGEIESRILVLIEKLDAVLEEESYEQSCDVCNQLP